MFLKTNLRTLRLGAYVDLEERQLGDLLDTLVGRAPQPALIGRHCITEGVYS